MNTMTQNSLQTGAEIIRDYCKRLPGTPGVYRMLNEAGEVLYVGKAKSLKNRVSNYTQVNGLSIRIQRMVSQTRSMVFIHTKTEAEALLLESNLIKELKPPFNVIFRDDKSYPYIIVNMEHDYPKADKYRGQKKKRDGEFYGPFANASAVNRTLIALQKAFQIRNCTEGNFKNRTRPCLQYHIERCTAPCVGYVSKEDYAVQVQDMRDFLSGKSHTIKQKLVHEMDAASKALNYERAAKLRDRIRALSDITAHQEINIDIVGDADVIGIAQEGQKICIQVFFFRSGQNYGNRSTIKTLSEDMEVETLMSTYMAQFYENKPVPPTIYISILPDEQELLEEAFSERLGRNVKIIKPERGDKKRLIEFVLKNAREELARHISETASQQKLLKDVANLFGMDEPPKRIEVYDNSHLGGTGMVGAMIVAGPDGFKKTAYRKFNMREAEAGDDYGMMREMMTRRFARSLKEGEGPGTENWPDLLLIDGGKGQLSTVEETLSELGILDDLTVVGISKGPDRNAGREQFHMRGKEPFMLPHSDSTLHYLQRLRDESHRFVIGAQRTKRKMDMGSSPLDGISGIGPKKKKALLQYFGSAKDVSRAGIEDLMKVEGISKSIAETIYRYFHS